MSDLPARIRRTSIDIVYADGASQHIVINGDYEFDRRLRRDYPELGGVLSTRPSISHGHQAFEFSQIPEDQIREEIYFTDEQVKKLEDGNLVQKAKTVQQHASRHVTGQVSSFYNPAKYQVGDLVTMPAKHNPVGTPHRKRDNVWEVTKAEWLVGSELWHYSLEDRDRKVKLGVVQTLPVYESLQRVDRWPLRHGDFVKWERGGDQTVYKIASQVKVGDHYWIGAGPSLREGGGAVAYQASEGPAHFVDTAAGTREWLYDKHLTLVDRDQVTVTKKSETWKLADDRPVF